MPGGAQRQLQGAGHLPAQLSLLAPAPTVGLGAVLVIQVGILAVFRPELGAQRLHLPAQLRPATIVLHVE